MPALSKLCVILGFVFLSAGIIVWALNFLPRDWDRYFPLGHLPGDIFIRRDNFQLYFPLTTGLLISVVISAVAQIVTWLRK